MSTSPVRVRDSLIVASRVVAGLYKSSSICLKAPPERTLKTFSEARPWSWNVQADVRGRCHPADANYRYQARASFEQAVATKHMALRLEKETRTCLPETQRACSFKKQSVMQPTSIRQWSARNEQAYKSWKDGGCCRSVN